MARELHRSLRSGRFAVLATAIGVTAIGLVRSGGYFTPDLVAIPLFLFAAALLSGRRPATSDLRLLAALATFAAVWLWRGAATGTAGRAASLSAACVAFGSAFVLARSCRGERERALATRGLVLVGLFVALLSVFGWAADRTPWGLPFDGFWRLSGPFAYPNAAGLFFALALVVIVSQHDRSWFDRLGAGAVVFGALAATASRGAVVALVAGVAVLGVARWRPSRRALVIVGIGAALLVVYVGLVSAGVIGDTRAGNASASIDDRVAEAKSAWNVGFAHPVLGNGPERELVIHNFRGLAIARFAHNEVLQVWAGAGGVGVALLALIGVALVGVFRDEDRPRGRLALAGAVVLLVGGLLDFSWHFVGLVAYGGWLVGLDEAPLRVRERAPLVRSPDGSR